MNRRSLRTTIEFGGLELPKGYPRDLVSAVPLQLPLAFVSIRELATNTLEEWLVRRGIPYKVDGYHRRLHGALVARAGRGLVFMESSDDLAEQRFTAAHETAHFIEDHLVPRLEALRVFGNAILPVLDGERLATAEESISAVLNRVPLGVRVHLMARGPQGTICRWDVEEREQRADRMALELLAPATDALRALRRLSAPAGGATEIDAAADVLAQNFGLPASAAEQYAGQLLGRRRLRPKLSTALLGGNG